MFCGRCGTPNDDDAAFCTNCGTSLQPAINVSTESRRPPEVPPVQPPAPSSSKSKSSNKVVLALGAAVLLLIGGLLWNQFGGQPAQDATSADTATTDVAITTTSSTTTTSSSSTTTTTITTTTTLAPALYGFASSDLWIDDTPMALPPCDGSYIAIIASTSGSRAASGSRNYPDGNYLRTDITCDSLNPFFSSGALQGQPIYLIFFGPYYNRYDAQQKCLDLGIRKKANCYVAPLTTDSSDRSVRYGPLDS